MTIKELRSLTIIGDSSDKTFVHSENAPVIVAYRFLGTGRRLAPGVRCDLRCEVCGAQVALSPLSVTKIESGKRVACRECFAQATGRSLADIQRSPGG
jgi:hypothetical protein